LAGKGYISGASRSAFGTQVENLCYFAPLLLGKVKFLMESGITPIVSVFANATLPAPTFRVRVLRSRQAGCCCKAVSSHRTPKRAPTSDDNHSPGKHKTF
jgi:hypothetical protein